MQDQRDASVWPRLEVLPSRNSSDGLALYVMNKGVGPAIIKSTVFKANGKTIRGWRNFLLEVMKDSIGQNSNSTLNHRVLTASETLQIFKYKPKHIDLKTVYKRFAVVDFDYEIIYSSIYGALWRKTRSGTEKIDSFVYIEENQFE